MEENFKEIESKWFVFENMLQDAKPPKGCADLNGCSYITVRIFHEYVLKILGRREATVNLKKYSDRFLKEIAEARNNRFPHLKK